MTVRRLSLLAALVVTAAVLIPVARANPIRVGNVQVALVSEATSVQPGKPLTFGLHFELRPGWHVYWQNPGDSGQAPRVKWTLPAGFTAGELQWPAPHPIRTGPIMNFGYDENVLFPITVQAPAEMPPDVLEGQDATFKVKADWLVCKEDCIPGSAELSVRLPIRLEATPADPTHTALFATARAQLPLPTTATGRHDGDFLHLEVALPATLAAQVGKDARYRFFPSLALVTDHPAEQERTLTDRGITLRIKKDATRTDPLTEVAGLVVAEGNRERHAFSFSTPLAALVPVVAAVGPGGPVAAGAPSVPRAPEGGIGLALLFAFLGGLLLNLMPCVFPVLSLKVMSFVEHAHDPKTVRKHGFAYTAGVLLSFWGLAGALLIIRAGSERLGWGFQLQSPAFVALLIVLLFMMSLNLLGTFEIGLSLTRLGGIGGGGRLSGSFTTGVLATVVATPCTAPFMGSALGYALTQPAVIGFLVFTALALGMASPYLALGYFPSLLRRLPRPGAWMETVRQAMSFPLLATTIWLLAVFHQLTAPFVLFRLLTGLLVLGLGAWIYGRYQHSARRPLAALVLAVAIALTGAGVSVTGGEPMPRNAVASEGDGLWQPWSEERVTALRAEGRPVFVNFTAAWCISCKANELLVFTTPEIRKAFADHKVATLKADWTNRDDEIARTLESHGRAGVPLYLFYPAGRAGAPETLPAVLTKGIVLSALGVAAP